MALTDYRFGEAVKDADESFPVLLNCFPICANLWRANENYDATEFVRPNRPTGFSYECTTAGTSGAREPAWVNTIGATTPDGSVTWTCRAADDNGLNEITSPSATSDPVGLTVSSVVAVETCKISAIYAGGDNDQSYDVVYSFTLNSLPRVARQTVRVRKR